MGGGSAVITYLEGIYPCFRHTTNKILLMQLQGSPRPLRPEHKKAPHLRGFQERYKPKLYAALTILTKVRL